jgi:hypothetical protein
MNESGYGFVPLAPDRRRRRADRCDVIEAAICLAGAAIILFGPRSGLGMSASYRVTSSLRAKRSDPAARRPGVDCFVAMTAQAKAIML